MKIMTENHIPEFVQNVADTGYYIVAVMGGTGFLFGDGDLSPEDYKAAEPEIGHSREVRPGRSPDFEYLVSTGRYWPPTHNPASRALS